MQRSLYKESHQTTYINRSEISMGLEGLDNYKVADIKKNFNTRFLGAFKFNYWIELGHKGNISLVFL